MDFKRLVEEVVSGGSGSAFGPGVTDTATAFSGDNYAPGDARIPKSIFGGVVTRGGLAGKKKKKSKKYKKATKRHKKKN
tara:strand:- start:214 stop:450 length:237 start_codon:yes stop_codon:yes gene_type:complete